jgi:hypothetical protein
MDRADRGRLTRLPSAAGAALAILVACAPNEGGEGAGAIAEALDGSVEFDDLFVRERVVALEETATALSVTPFVTVEPTGGIIVADPSEAQVRVYDRDGRIQQTFGSRGDGPGEFVAVVRAMRRPGTEDILVLDMVRGVLSFSGSGEYLGPLADTLFQYYQEMIPFGRLHILVTGRRAGAGSPSLAVMDAEDGRIVASGFVRPSPPSAEVLQGSDWVKAEVGGGAVAIIRALSDTVYLVNAADPTEPPNAVPIPMAHPFEPLPPPEQLMRLARRELSERLVRVHDVFWLDQLLIVQIIRRRDQVDHWSLVGMSRVGERRFEVEDGPRLLDVRDGKLLFVDPGALVPNRFLWVAPRCELLGC